MLFKSLLLAVTPFLALAAPSFGGSSYSSLVASTCPKGYTRGAVSNVASFPVSVKTLSSDVDSFFTAEWEGFSVANTTGKDNKFGALRSFSFGGIVPLTEELVYFFDSAVLVDRLWYGVGGKYKGDLPVVAPAFDVSLASWVEHFTISPICKGKAAKFSWQASYCSTNDAVAESLYTSAHTGPYAALHEKYGNFTSC